jgi:purine-nucleoside phosphorylase
MPCFKRLFGLEKDRVQKTCVLMPFIPPGAIKALGTGPLINGRIFASASSPDLTVIRTGVGAGFVGDCVLYLKDSPCKNIVFMGSAGLVNKSTGLDIGSLTLPETAWGFEGFNSILEGKTSPPVRSYPHAPFLAQFRAMAPSLMMSRAISFPSLFLEGQWMPEFRDLEADVIEMECATLFLTAKKTGQKAMAVLFISDILQEKPLGIALSARDKKNLTDGIGQACNLIKEFASGR